MSFNKKEDMADGVSSDDEDSFFICNSFAECGEKTSHANALEATDSLEAKIKCITPSLSLTTMAATNKPAANNTDSLDDAYSPANYSRQTFAQLKRNYHEHFIEMEQDTITTGDSSPKHRKTLTNASPASSASASPASAITPKLCCTSLSASSSSASSSSLSCVRASDDSPLVAHRSAFFAAVCRTKSARRFVKIAYPELVDIGSVHAEPQPLLIHTEQTRLALIKEMSISRLSNDTFERRVVFDVNRPLSRTRQASIELLDNDDLKRIGRPRKDVPHLIFESRFESGNLHKSIQVSPTHYELILSQDINASRSHYQWFYFEVSNNEANLQYTFEIINCLKTTSMFSKGMQPVFFSVTEASRGNSGWIRASNTVCYHRNFYTSISENDADSCVSAVNGRTSETQTPSANCERDVSPNKQQQQQRPSLSPPKRNSVGLEKKRETAPAVHQKSVDEMHSRQNANIDQELKTFYSTQFTITFRHAADICYIAYHFPYTYSYLNATLERVLARNTSENASFLSIYVRDDVLAKSLAGNVTRLITITAPGSVREIRQREIVLFTARVHPGECNASWIMHGILKYLLSPAAAKIRELFVFKLVPMLNPDGVINGNHRCSLAGVDLNRVWNAPSECLHPTIFHTKGLIQYMTEILDKRPFVFVDFHGHSRKSNIFLYGNNPAASWQPADNTAIKENNIEFMILPEILERISPAFNLADCRFSVTKIKEFSARIAMWRQFGIRRVYTMEASYCGFDRGPYVGKQMTTEILMDMGASLCVAIMHMKTTDITEFIRERNGKSLYLRGRSRTTSSSTSTIVLLTSPTTEEKSSGNKKEEKRRRSRKCSTNVSASLMLASEVPSVLAIPLKPKTKGSKKGKEKKRGGEIPTDKKNSQA